MESFLLHYPGAAVAGSRVYGGSLPVCSYVGVREAASTGPSALPAQKMDVAFGAL